MTTQLDVLLKQRNIYVPRGTKADTLQLGKALGLALALQHRKPVTVLSVEKRGVTVHAELAKQTIVTERSGSVSDGGVVLAWCPRPRTMEKVQHLEDSVVVLVEWIPGEFDGWARVNGAYNMATKEVMTSGLTDTANAVIDQITAEGYKGWTDATSKRMVRSYLRDLEDLGEYDREIVIASARKDAGESSVERLVKILSEHEAEGRSSAASARNWEL